LALPARKVGATNQTAAPARCSLSRRNEERRRLICRIWMK